MERCTQAVIILKRRYRRIINCPHRQIAIDIVIHSILYDGVGMPVVGLIDKATKGCITWSYCQIRTDSMSLFHHLWMLGDIQLIACRHSSSTCHFFHLTTVGKQFQRIPVHRFAIIRT